MHAMLAMQAESETCKNVCHCLAILTSNCNCHVLLKIKITK